MNWITELGWAIELSAMYQRWLFARDLLPDREDEAYVRAMWVRMCMRLGDHASLQIVRGTQAGRKGEIKWTH